MHDLIETVLNFISSGLQSRAMGKLGCFSVVVVIVLIGIVILLIASNLGRP